MSQLETNTISLQTLLDKVNALPEASSGEDVTDETNTYTSLLTELETAIDELPDAGSGGVETCTVTISGVDASGRPKSYVYTALDDNGDICYYYEPSNADTEVTLENVVCNSIISVRPYSNTYTKSTLTNATQLFNINDNGYNAYRITAAAGENATIKFSQDGGGSND